MSVENLSEQLNLIHSTIDNLKHSGETQTTQTISQYVDHTKQTRRQQLDHLQETLQTLSRRLQTARTRVDATKAEREQKSHQETMRELEHERQTTNEGIAEQEHRQLEYGKEIEDLQRQLEALSTSDVDREGLADVGETVLKLQILRGLGVEPLVDDGRVGKVRVWSEQEAAVVKTDGNAYQLANKLWDVCSN